ncbi:unnamed protein product [Linum tenue]|uniref:Dirigent protein n=2 Tax=Linum tenue TaxID=586396 RepID=A0AAV0J108_9ROSI|nr:unnamed protein product [Linum tenue]CAI0402633.1 unnamed protein product [Linum tenue]CAI0402638.1 unnamed protein product [Linum tenue]
MAKTANLPPNHFLIVSIIQLVIFSSAFIIPTTTSAKLEMLTHLHFYYHNNIAGPRATAVPINPKIQPVDLRDPASLFGRLTIADDPLTSGPSLENSTVVGSAQGMYGSASQTEMSFAMVFNFALTQGKYKGSSFCLLGRNPIFTNPRELAIVGGTGAFRFSRGYAMLKTYYMDMQTGANTIVEYDVYIRHY